MTAREKRESTCEIKYGCKNVAQVPEVQDLRRKAFESKRKTFIAYQDPRVIRMNANELTLFRLDKKVADEWLDRFHPFKHPRGNILCLGLVQGSKIYCVMTFKKSRNPKYVAELSRMGMLPNHEIIGGYDRLSSFASQYGLYNIVAYVNRSFENVSDYESIGMKYSRELQRTLWWVKGQTRISDASRRQHGYSRKQMSDLSYAPMYDCGTAVYEYID